MTLFKDILVPIDYSEPADAALRLAARLAHAANGRLLVAHVLMPGTALTESPILPVDSDWIGEERTRLAAHVQERLAHAGVVPPFSVEVEADAPFLGIVRLAAERKVDCIVMGSQGRSALRRLALGGVVEKVVRLAPCPVITVHGDVDAGSTTAAGARASHPRALDEGTELPYRSPVTIAASATLAEARSLLARYGIRHLPVVDGHKLVGMLSDADLGPHVGYLDRTKVDAAMTPNPTTIGPDANAAVAADLMLRHKVRALPVTDGEEVIGVVSVTDILEEYLRAARR
jgi:nucleotide-binding universal stress UspA family protein